MWTRLLTALLMIPPVVALLWLNPLGRGTFVLVGVLAAGLLAEYINLANRHGARLGVFDFALMWVASLVWMVSVGSSGFARWHGAVLVLLALGSLAPVLISGDTAGAHARVAGVVFGAVYVGWCFARHTLMLYEVDGGRWALVALGVVWAADSAAYFVGRTVGRHPLAPAISPAKTWEGAAAGLLAAIIAAALVARFLLPDQQRVAVGGGVIIGVVGQVSDLFESALKRDAGVKDSGNWIPGHGGLLDRLDSLIFAVPVLYYYLLMAGTAS